MCDNMQQGHWTHAALPGADRSGNRYNEPLLKLLRKLMALAS